MPAAVTTCSASIGPWSVSTPMARPWAVRMRSTETPSKIRAPRSLATVAMAMVVSTGDA